MAEVITLSLALRPVRIELQDAQMADELREQSQGFILPNTQEPWLSISVRPLLESRDDLEYAVVEPAGGGKYSFYGPRLRGTLEVKERLVAEGEVFALQSLHQLFHLCLSMILPLEGALIIHADSVEWNGEAVSFFGPSGRGKSTAARQMIEGGGQLIAVDRTVIEAGPEGVAVLTLPNMGRREVMLAEPRSVKVSGFVYPRRGKGVVVCPMTRFDALHRLLQAVNFPRGDGLPVSHALDTVERILSHTWAAEVLYKPGNQFHNELPFSRMNT